MKILKTLFASSAVPVLVIGVCMSVCVACSDPSLCSSSSWFGRLEGCGWLSHVSRLLEYARKITNLLHVDGERLE